MQHYLSFRVAHEWYGVNVRDVIEVLPLVALNEIPGTDVLGLLTLRSEILPVIALRQRFGLPAADLNLDTPIIAVRSQHGSFGLLVDEADRVEHIPADTIQPYNSRYVSQVAQTDRGLLLLLDLEKLDVRQYER